MLKVLFVGFEKSGKTTLINSFKKIDGVFVSDDGVKFIPTEVEGYFHIGFMNGEIDFHRTEKQVVHSADMIFWVAPIHSDLSSHPGFNLLSERYKNVHVIYTKFEHLDEPIDIKVPGILITAFGRHLKQMTPVKHTEFNLLHLIPVQRRLEILKMDSNNCKLLQIIRPQEFTSEYLAEIDKKLECIRKTPKLSHQCRVANFLYFANRCFKFPRSMSLCNKDITKDYIDVTIIPKSEKCEFEKIIADGSEVIFYDTHEPCEYCTNITRMYLKCKCGILYNEATEYHCKCGCLFAPTMMTVEEAENIATMDNKVLFYLLH